MNLTGQNNKMQELLVDVVSPELNKLDFSIHQQFERLVSVCTFLEQAIQKEMKHRRDQAQCRRKHGKGEEERAFNSVAIDDYLFEIERDFPRLVRYSFLVSMMSTTESCLVRLCRVAHTDLGIEGKFKEGGHDVIQRALKYLQKDAGLDTSRMHYYKELADGLRRMRNAVTHSGGCIKGRNDEHDIQAFAKLRTGVRIDKARNIVLSSRFVRNNAHGMKNLIVQLFARLRKQIGARKVS